MYLHILIAIFVCLFQISAAHREKIKVVGSSLKLQSSDLKLLENMILNIPENFVKIHDNLDFRKQNNSNESSSHFHISAENIKQKYADSKHAKCYEAMRNFTKDLLKGDYKQMMLSGFTDLADVGDYDRWKSLPEIASYNYLQMNLTYLPI